MVQDKSSRTQKAKPVPKAKVAPKQKAKIVPPISTASKTATKKAAKSTPISNGYRNGTSKQIDKIESSGKGKTKQIEEIAATSQDNVSDSEIPESSEPSKPGTSKELINNNDFAEKTSDSEPLSEDENPLAIKETAAASSNPKKRGRPAKEVEPKNTVKKVPSVQNIAKSKRQKKTLLEIPPLRSTPGKVFVVGDNDVGQLGLKEEGISRPTILDLPYSIIDVTAGGMHSVCLTENGEVITFGCNDEGALGRVTSDEEEESTPGKVDIPEKIVQISAGDSHSAALSETGQVYLWGSFRNAQGQMGLTVDGQKSLTPLKILTHITVVKIASGVHHLACLANNGIVYTCGCGEQGQLGRLSSRRCCDGGRKGKSELLEPAPVHKLRTPTSDMWTEHFATFLKVQDSGSIYAFGLNNYNQLGLDNKNDQPEHQLKYFPERVASFNDKNWQQVNGGEHHTLALDSDGSVYALGRSNYGRLGLGENEGDKSTPTLIPALQKEKCTNVSCSTSASFAVTEQGAVYSWGMASNLLGQGNTYVDEDIHIPRLIERDLLNSWEVLKLSGGGHHALILACPKKSSSKNKKA